MKKKLLEMRGFFFLHLTAKDSGASRVFLFNMTVG